MRLDTKALGKGRPASPVDFRIFAAALAVLLVIATYPLVRAWVLNQQLQVEVKSLSSRISTGIPPKPPVSDVEAEVQKLRRSVLSLARSESADSISMSENSLNAAHSADQSESSVIPTKGPLSSVSGNTWHPSPLTLDSFVTRALPLRVEVTASQNAQASSSTGAELDVIVTGVRGIYADVRSWLIEITDADTNVLLSSVQLRRESPKQSHVIGDIRFLRVRPLSGR